MTPRSRAASTMRRASRIMSPRDVSTVVAPSSIRVTYPQPSSRKQPAVPILPVPPAARHNYSLDAAHPTLRMALLEREARNT